MLLEPREIVLNFEGLVRENGLATGTDGVFISTWTSKCASGGSYVLVLIGRLAGSDFRGDFYAALDQKLKLIVEDLVGYIDDLVDHILMGTLLDPPAIFEYGNEGCIEGSDVRGGLHAELLEFGGVVGDRLGVLMIPLRDGCGERTKGENERSNG